MAIIGSIRKRSGLLIIMIGVAILLFILGDMFSSGGLMTRAIPTVGSINGEEVNSMELDRETQRIKNLYATYGSNINDEQARRQAWSGLVRQKVYFKGIDDIGMAVTDEEYDDLRWGEGVVDEFVNEPRYKDAQGQFAPDSVKMFFTRVYEGNPQAYRAEKKRLIENQLTNKYNNLISKSVYYNNIDGAEDAKAKSTKMTVDFAFKNFNTIADSTVTVSEDAMKAYYEAHKNEARYEQAEGRDIDYIVFDVEPTAEDIEFIKEQTAELKDDFAKAANDSTYIISYSDVQNYNVIPYKRGTRADAFDAQLADAEVGAIVGPYKDGDYFKLSKVIGKEPKEEAKVRHILLNSAIENEDISNRADSILRAIKRADVFDELAAKYTEDPGYAQNKGTYDWFGKGAMVREFEDFSFENLEGAKGVVKTQYGYHIIEVLGRRSEEQSQIVELVKEIVPSRETSDAAYQVASGFAIDYSTADKFEAGAKEKGLVIKEEPNLSMSAANIGQVQDAREIVRWAFKDERVAGEVSEAFPMEDQYVVVRFNDVKLKGTPKYEHIKDVIKAELIKDVKAKKIAEMVGGASGLDAIASAMGVSVENDKAISMNTSGLPGVGSDPSVIGKIFKLENGATSQAIQGKSGVYYVHVDSKGDTPEVTNVDINKTNLAKQTSAGIKNKVQSAMNEAANVENVMDKFY